MFVAYSMCRLPLMATARSHWWLLASCRDRCTMPTPGGFEFFYLAAGGFPELADVCGRW